MAKEIHLNTEAQVRKWIASALAIVDELPVPDDLRVAAFTQAAQLLAAKQIFWSQADAMPDVLPALGPLRNH